MAFGEISKIMTFPAGEVSRKHNGSITDGQWHRSSVRNPVDYQRDVILIYIHAKNSLCLYRLGLLRE